MTETKGALIAFEGIDNSGKTTQVRACAERLQKVLPTRAIRVTAEPSSSDPGILARDILNGKFRLPNGQPPSDRFLAELFAMDREHHVRTYIQPWLSEGAIVLCDRYIMSNLAYQWGVFGVEALNANAPLPDMTVYLDVTPTEAEARMRRAGKTPDLMEANRERLHAALRAYRELVHRTPLWTLSIDGTLPVDEMTDKIVETMVTRLKSLGAL